MCVGWAGRYACVVEGVDRMRIRVSLQPVCVCVCVGVFRQTNGCVDVARVKSVRGMKKNAK